MRQLSRLERMHPDAAETATLRTYLDWMVSLPWSNATKDNLDLIKAQKILDEDHYGLEKIGSSGKSVGEFAAFGFPQRRNNKEGEYFA